MLNEEESKQTQLLANHFLERRWLPHHQLVERQQVHLQEDRQPDLLRPQVEVHLLHNLLPKSRHHRRHRYHRRLRHLSHQQEDPRLVHQLRHQKRPLHAALQAVPQLVAPQRVPQEEVLHPLRHNRRPRSQRQQVEDLLPQVCPQEDLPLAAQLVVVLHLACLNQLDLLQAEVAPLLAVPHQLEEAELPHLLAVEEHQPQREEAVRLPLAVAVLPRAEAAQARVVGEVAPALEEQPKAPSRTNLRSSPAKR